MINLRPDCLVFELSTGEQVPLSAEDMALELILGPGQTLDPEVIRNAAAAVLHYFRTELMRSAVSVLEFTHALQKVLNELGFTVREMGDGPVQPVAPAELSSDAMNTAEPQESVPARRSELDLARLLESAGLGGELYFFNALRTDLSQRLDSQPDLIVCSGLRSCAKNLCAARRWTDRCQRLSDQIVDFVRACLKDRNEAGKCVLCVC